MKAINRVITNHIFQNLKGIIFNNVKIFQFALFDFRKHLTYTRSMNFNSKIVYFRICFSKGNSCVPHSKTDFNYNRICVSKNINKIKLSLFERNTPGRSQLIIGALLCSCHAARTQHISFYFSSKPRGYWFCLFGIFFVFDCICIIHQWLSLIIFFGTNRFFRSDTDYSSISCIPDNLIG